MDNVNTLTEEMHDMTVNTNKLNDDKIPMIDEKGMKNYVCMEEIEKFDFGRNRYLPFYLRKTLNFEILKEFENNHTMGVFELPNRSLWVKKKNKKYEQKS